MAEIASNIGVGLSGRLLMKFCPPLLLCGCPAQRAKNEDESWWHIPVKIQPRFPLAPDFLPDCSIWAELFNGSIWADKIQMRWGDVQFHDPVSHCTLRAGEPYLVPIVWRKENDERIAYITDEGYFRQHTRKWRCSPDRKKRRLRLIVSSGGREFLDGYKSTYIIRVPFESGNGHFVLEKEFQGRGSHPVSFEFLTDDRNGSR